MPAITPVDPSLAGFRAAGRDREAGVDSTWLSRRPARAIDGDADVQVLPPPASAGGGKWGEAGRRRNRRPVSSRRYVLEESHPLAITVT